MTAAGIPPLRLGLVGAGANTREKHLPGFRALPGVTVTRVANRGRASAERVAREFQIPGVAGDWAEVVHAPDVDAVCIGTWPNLHAPVAIAALRAGKHVLTEARMAATLAEAEAMARVARAHPGRVAQVVPAPLSLPYDAAIIELLADGTLGPLREIGLVSTNGASADPASPLTWRQQTACSGHNTLYLGIFYETVFRWLRRHPEFVTADAAIFTHTRPDATGGAGAADIPERLTVAGTYADGARLLGQFSSIETSRPRSEIRLNGTKAGLLLDFASGELLLTRAGQTARVVVPPAKRGRWSVEEDFVRSIREGAPVVLTDFATGVEYMRFTDAVWRSWNDGGARMALPPAG